MGATTTTSTEERALELLGDGIDSVVVANALGISESRIAQLLADEEFANKVTTLRYHRLQAHTARDNKYDLLEDQLLEKLEHTLPLMMRPMEILKSIQVINAAKRRGTSAPEAITQQHTIVKLTMPVHVVNQHVVQLDINNQVVQAGNQSLVTMQSKTLLDKLNGRKTLPAPAATAEPPEKSTAES